MPYPDARDTYSSDWNLLHTKEADKHHRCHHAENAKLRSHTHLFMFHETVQMFLIYARSKKPLMQLLRTLRKAYNGCHIERYGRKNRNHNSYRSCKQTYHTGQYPDNSKWITFHHVYPIEHFLSIRNFKFYKKAVFDCRLAAYEHYPSV